MENNVGEAGRAASRTEVPSTHLGATPRAAETNAKQGALGSESARRFKVLTCEEVEELPDPAWLVQGVLPARSLGVLYGPPNVGKTFLALDLACSVATASPWLGRATTPGATVYIVTEGVAGLGKRIRAWREAHGSASPDRTYFVSDSVQLHSPNEVETFVRDIQEQVPEPVALVVFDTLARCFVGGEENSAKEAGMLVDGAEQVRKRFKAAVLLVHHTTKNGEAERGSSAFRGAMDTMLEVSDAAVGISLSCGKQKDAPAFPPILLRLVPVGTSCVVRPAEGEAASGKALEALRVLAEASPDGLSSADWKDRTGLSDTTFYRYLRDLKQGGQVQEMGKKYQLTEKGRSALGVTSSAAG